MNGLSKRCFFLTGYLAVFGGAVALFFNSLTIRASAQPQDPWHQWLCMVGANPPVQVQETPSTPSPARQPDYPLARPGRISSGYGTRTHPVTGNLDFHQGLDLAAPAGTPVLASLEGQVLHAGWLGNLGNSVVLEHGSERTRYGHMMSVAVQANDWVRRGQIVGYVGSTGRSTGPHLHFEHWKLNSQRQWVTVDPRELMARKHHGDAEAIATGSPVGGVGGIGEDINRCG